MAITIYQQPAYQDKRIHQKIYPTYYTCQSNYYAYDDFKYKFELYDDEGLVATSYNPPYITGGLGVYSPNAVLKNKLEFNFNPDATGFESVANFMINYRVDVTENSESISSPATHLYNKCYILNSPKEDLEFTDYICNNDDKSILSDWNSVRTVTLNDEGTGRAIAGKIKTNVSYVYQLYLIRQDEAGNKYYYTSQFVNPFYGNTTVNGVSNDNSVLEVMDEYIVEFPLLPENINQGKWNYAGYQANGGTYSAVTPTQVVTNILKEGNEYSIQTYAWPNGNGGITSKKYNFKIQKPCTKDNNEVIQFGWQNEVGGVDYYTAYFNRMRQNKQKKDTFKKIRDKQGHNNNYSNNQHYVGHTDYDRGNTIYNLQQTQEWSVFTDNLSDDELTDLYSLFNSTEVYARIDSKWYPITIINENYNDIIDKKGLKKVEIKFVIDNIKEF